MKGEGRDFRANTDRPPDRLRSESDGEGSRAEKEGHNLDSRRRYPSGRSEQDLASVSPSTSCEYFAPPGPVAYPSRSGQSSPNSSIASDRKKHGTTASSTGGSALTFLDRMRADLPDARAASTGRASSASSGSNRSHLGPSSGSSSPRTSSSTGSGSARRKAGFGYNNVNTLRGSAEAPDLQYELVIRQQPGKAAAAGMSAPALSRLPIVPSPILQLIVRDGAGRSVPIDSVLQMLPYLVCSGALLPAQDTQDSDTAIDFVISATSDFSSTSGEAGGGIPLAMLCGTRVYSPLEARDPDGENGLFFIFWDTSIRQIGEYRMKFSLLEALPGSSTLATVVSTPFSTVQMAQFPGSVEIATDLTRHFQRQGLSIYMPPLGMSTS